MENAALNGAKYGANGYLITDWFVSLLLAFIVLRLLIDAQRGDHGHFQPTSVSYLGFFAGAGYSWNTRSTHVSNLKQLLEVHVFKDEAGILGTVVTELGKSHLITAENIPNNTFLSMILQVRVNQTKS